MSMSALVPSDEAANDALLPTFVQRETVYKRSLDAQKQREAELASQIAQKQADQNALIHHQQLLLRPQLPPHHQIQYPPPPNVPKRGLQAVTLYRDSRPSVERLVPIRVDCEVEGVRLRDTFTLNLNESSITPEVFADILCDDLQAPPQLFHHSVVRAIKEQVADCETHAPSAIAPGNPQGQGNGSHDNSDLDASDLRFIIKLDITIGNYCLTDQFEWDLNCKRNSPEKFAEVMVNELELPSEFRTAIAHSIREQIHILAKSLLLIDHKFDGSMIEDEELASCFLSTLTQPRRIGLEAWNAFGPSLMEVREVDVDRLDRDYERETRRKRRQTRGRRHGVTLPDREIARIYRSSLPPGKTDPSQLIPNAVTKLAPGTLVPGITIRNNDGLFITASIPNPISNNAGTQHANSPGGILSPPTVKGRKGRAAAAAAAATIAAIAQDEAIPDFPLKMPTDPDKVGTYRCYKCGGPALMPIPLPPGTRQSDIYCENCRFVLSSRPTPPSQTTRLSSSDSRQRTASPRPPSLPPSTHGPTSAISSFSPPTHPPPPSFSASSSSANLLAPSPVGLPSQPSAQTAPNNSDGAGITSSNHQEDVKPSPSSSTSNHAMPQWLPRAFDDTLSRFPHDRFELTVKNASFKVRCLECEPRKIYEIGPDETLSNFEVHLRNKKHRQFVNKRLGENSSSRASTPKSASTPGGNTPS